MDICNHCGNSVRLGSGRFANRIPDLNDIATRDINGLPFPKGDFVCERCDSSADDWFDLVQTRKSVTSQSIGL